MQHLAHALHAASSPTGASAAALSLYVSAGHIAHSLPASSVTKKAPGMSHDLVGALVGDALGAQIGDALGAFVGFVVGVVDGVALGLHVGDREGEELGARVGLLVGDIVNMPSKSISWSTRCLS